MDTKRRAPRSPAFWTGGAVLAAGGTGCQRVEGFTENAASFMMELSRVYPGGILRVAGSYSTFVE